MGGALFNMGKSLELVGNSFGRIANTASLSFTGPGTIMAMIKIEKTISKIRVIFTKGSDITSSGGWGAFIALTVNNTILGANVTGSTQYNTQGVTTLVPGQWYHIAYTWSSSGRKLYINGVLDVSAAGVGGIRHNGDSLIGVSANGREGFFTDGLLDEISLWNKELTQSEIQSYKNKALDPSQANLVAYWNFDNDVMPIATDITANNHKATFTPGAILSLDDSLAIIGKSLIFHDGKLKRWNPEIKGEYKSVVPAMTSATTPSGIVEQSSIWGAGYEGFRAFDKKLKVHADGTWHTKAGAPQWISYDIGKLRRVDRVSITARTDSLVSSQGVKDFVVQAFKDGAYIDLAEFTTTVWSAGETRTFDFKNSNYYSKYRLYVKSAFTTGAFAITEIDFLESKEGETAHWSTYDAETVNTSQFFLENGMDSIQRETVNLLPITLNLLALENKAAYSQTLDLSSYNSIQSIKIETLSFSRGDLS